MRTTTFDCPACQQKIEAPVEIAGQTVACPTCGQNFTAPPVEIIGLRSFDLNIEEVLENWEVEHALREIIANALDEQVISNTAEIEITKDEQSDWRIRDYGRGLQIEHFTLNENKEKLDAPSGVIGKFGVGLKDALRERAGAWCGGHRQFGRETSQPLSRAEHCPA
jgi:hypothetical protein